MLTHTKISESRHSKLCPVCPMKYLLHWSLASIATVKKNFGPFIEKCCRERKNWKTKMAVKKRNVLTHKPKKSPLGRK